MTKRKWVLAVVLGVLGSTSVALAHHSAAMFDNTKTTEVSGVVKSWLWTNPHSLLIVMVKGAAGDEEYFFEANGPGYLVTNGWKRESIKAGDVVTVTMNPLRDGSHGGNLLAVTFADGRVLSARIGGAGPPRGGGPATRGGGPQ
jgi:hypothetical protein